MDTNIKTVVIVYKVIDSRIQYLLKRDKEDGVQAARPEGWWEFPGGGVKFNETIASSTYRELYEETGIREEDILKLIPGFHTFAWQWQDEDHLSIVTACQVSADQKIILEPTEHEEFAWLSFEEAYARLTYQNPKRALEKLNHMLVTFKKLN